MVENVNGKYFCPRLIDYVVIVGIKQPSCGRSVNLPQLLRRYPLEDHKDFSLPLDSVYFCQPEGCHSGQRKLNLRQINTFVFALTEKDTNRVRYGNCINFYRTVEVKKPIKMDSTVRAQSHSTLKDEQESEENKENFEKKTDEINTRRKRKKRQSTYNNSLTSICIISHHPFFSTFRNCLFIIKKSIEYCNEKLLNDRKQQSSQCKRDCIWRLLTGDLPDGLVVPDSVLEEVAKIETLILRLLSAPVPVPGKTKVELELVDARLIAPLAFALPDNTRFSLVDFPLHLPLELLGVETCLKVLTCILLEHKLILQSEDCNALSMSVMAFVTMIYPLEYMFPVIPLLPTCMKSAEQLLLAPTPYIIGVPASFLRFKSNFRLPNDVWLVDLDSNKIKKPARMEDLPPLPEPEGSILFNHLSAALQTMSPGVVKSNEYVHSSDSSTQQSISSQRLIFGNDIDSIDVATRVAMVRFFNSSSLLANFSEHTRTIKLYPRPVVAFQINSFLQSRPKSSVFLAKFAQTQAVEYFAEWALLPSNVAFLRVQTGLFDPAIIGDKAKWYSRELDTIYFKVHSEATADLSNAFKPNRSIIGNHSSNDETKSGKSGSDSDMSTSSSYSSISDIVAEMFNSDIGDMNTHQHAINSSSKRLFCDLESIYQPPSILQLPDSSKCLMPSPVDGDKSRKPRSTRGSVSSLPINSSSADDDSSLSADDEEMNAIETHDDDAGDTTLRSTPVTMVPSTVATSKQSQSPTPVTSETEHFDSVSRSSTSSRISIADHRPVSAEPSLERSDSQSSVISRTISISSVFLRTGSVGSSQTSQTPNSQLSFSPSFLDRFTSEARERAREAKAAAVGASKSAFEATKKEVGKKKLLKNLQALGEPMKESAREIWRNSQEKDRDDDCRLKKEPDSSSIISSVSNDFNGLADKTTSMLSGLFGSKASGLAEKVHEKAHKLSHFPKAGRRGLVERTSLIKHSNNRQRKMSDTSRGADDSRSLHSDNQQFLKEVVNSVMEGEGVGWLKWSRVKKLMEDESYRNLVVSGLNKSLERKVGPDDHIEDVMLTKQVWKGIFKLLLAMIYGLEQSYAHNGLGGMASAFSTLEIAHTHYWAKEITEQTRGESSVTTTASASQSSSPFGSGDNLQALGDAATPTSEASLTKVKPHHHQPISPEKEELSPAVESLCVPESNDKILNRLNSADSEVSDGNTENPFTKTASGASITLNPTLYGGQAALGNSNIPRSTCSESDLDANIDINGRQSRAPSVWSSKSSVSTGYRYHGGNIIGSSGVPSNSQRTYLFQGLIGREKSNLWNHMQFWEDAFLDAVSQESEIVGKDQDPREMMDRYRALQDIDKKRLEHEEDRLLATLLYNMTAFMVMLGVYNQEIKRKVRRLLGKCHIGVVYSDEINALLEQIDNLHGNDIDLKPLASRQMHRQTFTVHLGTDATGDMLLMEVLCLWRRNGGATQLHKYYTKKCKELYYCIKGALEKASRGADAFSGTDLGGEFPVQDMKTGEGGLLQVCMESVGLLFAFSKFFVRIENIRKCFTQKDGIFILEEFNPKTRQLTQRKYKSQMADQICYSVLCLFSYIAAVQQKKRNQLQSTGESDKKSTAR